MLLLIPTLAVALLLFLGCLIIALFESSDNE